MRFLLKLFILGFIGLTVLPAFAPEEYQQAAAGTADGPQAPSAFELTSVVGRAAADVRGICDRQPGVCETGKDLISYAGTRAREGLVIAYAMFRHGHPSMAGEMPENAAGETAAQ